MTKYAKFFVAAGLAALYALQAALSDSVITSTEWTAVGIQALAAVGVYFVPNRDPDTGANLSETPRT